MADTLNVALEFDTDEEAEAAAASLRTDAERVTVQKSNEIFGVDDLAVVFAVIAVGTFATWLAEKIRDWDDHGIMVTSNGKGKVTIRELKAIDEGWILYIDPKGESHLYDTQQDSDKMGIFMDAARKGATPDAKDLPDQQGKDGATKDTPKPAG